jgi:hypothetical protein
VAAIVAIGELMFQAITIDQLARRSDDAFVLKELAGRPGSGSINLSNALLLIQETP